MIVVPPGSGDVIVKRNHDDSTIIIQSLKDNRVINTQRHRHDHMRKIIGISFFWWWLLRAHYPYILISSSLTTTTTTTKIIFFCNAQQRSDPSQFNGGSILAMAGRNSVAIAIDARFGLGMQTIYTGERSTTSATGRNLLRNTIHDDDHIDEDAEEEGVAAVVTERSGNPRILLLPGSNTLLAWTGLYGDGMSFAEEVNWVLARKLRKSGCIGFPGTQLLKRNIMSPRSITMLISHLLYRRKNAPYYVEPVIVGLERVRVPILFPEEQEKYCDEVAESVMDNNDDSSRMKLLPISHSETYQKIMLNLGNDRRTSATSIQGKTIQYRTIQRPYLCGTDMLGAKSTSSSFICSGVASRSLHGTAEALWKPNLEGEELVEVCGKAFLSALERDILSGYGAVVYLIQGIVVQDDSGKEVENEEDRVQIIEYILACRND